MKYRIVEREYPNLNITKYVVEKQVPPANVWESIFTSQELEEARAVYDERVARSTYTEKVLTV